ncbi:MAG: DUF6057 family protein [Phycisphaerales bacterium]
MRIAEMARGSILDHHRLESCLSAAVFLGLVVYLWKGIAPPLLYCGFGVFAAYPIVSGEGSFLRATFSTAGAPMSALAALLAQSYSHAWLGALTIAAVLGAMFLGIRRLLRSGQAEKFRDLAWIPLLLALTICNNYYENPLPVLLTVGLSVWTAILYDALPARTPLGRAGSFLILFGAVYYLAGAAAFVFVGIACLTEVLLHRKILSAIAQGALAVGGAFVLGWFVFGLEPRAICTAGTPWDPGKALKLSPLAGWLALVLHTFVPSVVLVAFLGQALLEADSRMRTRQGRRQGHPQPASKTRQARWKQVDSRVWIGVRMLAVAVTAVLCLTFTRTHARFERALHYHAQRRDWNQVLALAGRMRGKHRFTRSGVFDINRALAHQGRLGSELCAFPQNDINTLFMSFDNMPGRVIHAKLIELYLDLGCLNAAEKNAYELLAQEGPSPHVLEALVRIHLAKDQYEPARVAFQALRKCVGCREYVRRWQPIMADPALAETDPLIQSWRRARLTRDDTSIALSPATIETLLGTIPDHRLAFEYLMACHLLRNERVQLIGRLSLLKPLGYTQLPRHYAEALLVHSLMTGTPVDAQGWTIDPDLQRQFWEIRNVVTESRGDDRMVYETLVPKYGGTYMFYSMFNLCGLK